MIEHVCDICGKKLNNYQANQCMFSDTKWICVADPEWELGYMKESGKLIDTEHSLEKMEICSECAGKIISFIRSMKN